MRFHEALARALSANGVDTLFGLMGDANLFFVNSFVRDCGGDFVGTTHEAGAALAALGYSMAGGGLGVCTVTHGPGLSNVVTPLIEGVKGTIPMLLVCGDTAIADRDNNQNIAQRELVLATGAGFEQLRTPQSIATDVASAIRRAYTERRPIALNVPVDFQWAEVEHVSAPRRAPQSRPACLDGPDMDDAVGIIAAARRPLVLAGRGAHPAETRAALRRFAERIEAPLATTLKGKGSFRGDPFDIGICGTLSTPVALDIVAASDCVIAFGSSLDRFTSVEGALFRNKRIVQVSGDAGEIGRLHRPDVGVVGDPGEVADRFRYWLDVAEIPGSGFRTAEMAEAIATWRPVNPNAGPDSGHHIDIVEALTWLDAALPQDRTLVTDAGRFVIQAWRHMHASSPDAFITTVACGSIGLGMGFALGASRARPNRPTVMVVGDGGFMLGGLAEFSTAVRHGMDLVVLLCNDGGYGAEHVQFRNRDMDPSLSLFAWPDMCQLARASGGDAIRIASRKDLDLVGPALRDRARPLLIELMLDPDHIPPVR